MKDNLIQISEAIEKKLATEQASITISDKAELALIAEMMKLPSRQARKAFAEHIGISWEEYQYLLHKWKHLINRAVNVGKQLVEKENSNESKTLE